MADQVLTQLQDAFEGQIVSVIYLTRTTEVVPVLMPALGF